LNVRRLLILALIALQGCAAGNRPTDMTAYARARVEPRAAEVARRYPKLTAEAETAHAAAVAAWQAGRAVDARHFARIARTTWSAAGVYVERRSYRARLAELQNQQRLVEERIGEARKRRRDALRVSELKAELAVLERRTLALEAARHPDAATLKAALGDLALAEDHDAARIVQTDELQARTTFEAALDWAERTPTGTPDSPLPERSRSEVASLLALVMPRWREERHLLDTNRALALVLEDAAMLPEVEAGIEGRGLVVTLRALFKDGETGVNPARLPDLERIAALAQRHPAFPVRVEGHTDPRAEPEAAQKVTEARARSAARALVEFGLPESRVESAGRGADQPIADNQTREGRVRNRRLEVIFVRPSPVEPVSPPAVNPGGGRAP
jgi:outer membrane protein OmpA-like peptidoglycan-associated protein